MNPNRTLLATGLVLAISCKPNQQKNTVQPAQAVPTQAGKQAEDALRNGYIKQEADFLGIPIDDPIIVSNDTKSLTPSQIQIKRSFNTLLYIDGFVMRAKQDLDKAGAGPGLQKASENYDLALLRADLIRGDIRAGRVDKATLRVGKMTSPITPDERALLDARNTNSDIQSLVNGRSQH